ncbi:hypothetical protein L1987_34408 [Smallanthus sonchifolius]|uniref:Uncharacterized protein n=1 Tax=Smallanthus sonchifolius TaxID=185202 RepID=A0ACB9HT07_9ASTR|nr:hypothetical protein L1987_34408 [Smallanthus sonchifolius]
MMLTLCREEKDWLKAKIVWRKMKDNNCVENSARYCLLVTTFLAFCQYRWDFALSAFRGMIKRKENPNIIIFNALIYSLGNNGQVDLAFKVHDCIKPLSHIIHMERVIGDPICFSKRCCTSAFLKGPTRDPICTQLRSPAALALSVCNVLNQMSSWVSPNAQSYNVTVQGFCLREKTESATKLYQEMSELGLSADHKTWAMMLQFLPRSYTQSTQSDACSPLPVAISGEDNCLPCHLCEFLQSNRSENAIVKA